MGLFEKSSLCLFFLTLLLSISTRRSCFIPQGPVFTSLSYWEALSAGSINVAELFLLANYLNGTAVEPYINDINSQYPFSGWKGDGNCTRRYSEVFNMSKLGHLLHLKREPVMTYRISRCQGKRETNAIYINYNETSDKSGTITGSECMSIIGINDLLKVEQILTDVAHNYYCLSNKLKKLPVELLRPESINVIVNWHGLRRNSRNRGM